MQPDAENRQTVVLAVDDDEAIRTLLDVGLRRAGYKVLAADSGRSMDAILRDHAVDLIVLDTMMPEEDGLSICKRLTIAKGPPVIMLSAAGTDLARIKGLDLGAEDYMSKPFNMDELVSRIRVVLRRRPSALTESETVTASGWLLQNRSRTLTSPAGKTLYLSTAEFALLAALFGQKNRPLRRHQLLASMADLHEASTDRSLDALISRLRKKMSFIDSDGQEDLIQTVYGVGYMLRLQKP